jgi:hypothetical protein
MKTVAGSPKYWRYETPRSPTTQGPHGAIFAQRRESAKTHGSAKPAALRSGRSTFVAIVLLAVCLMTLRVAFCQVAPAGDEGGFNLTVGATATGNYLQYGERKMLGVAAIADLDTKRRIGIEGEAQWLIFHQTANVHSTTYLIGPRYHLTYGRFQPYVKGLIGFGQFNYPYNYGIDNDYVIEPGAGVDFRITHRLRIRVADFEYQIWPQFHYGTLTSYGLSTGIRVRVF